ncbi:MAG: hypothetical protein R6V12_00045 [Candidatus Hydrogenedentota bacterium]
MRDNIQTSEKNPTAIYAEEDFAEFVPYLGMLCRVAWGFTGDPSETERLVEKAMLVAVSRARTDTSRRPPKMLLLGALREAYVESRKTIAP